MEEIIEKYQERLDKAQDELLLVKSFSIIVRFWIIRNEFDFEYSVLDTYKVKLFGDAETFYENGNIPFQTWIKDIQNYLNEQKVHGNLGNEIVQKILYKHSRIGLKQLLRAVEIVKETYEEDNLKIWKISELFELIIVSDKK